MNIRLLCITAMLSACITGVNAQTRLIAHKSHSGSNSTFKDALNSGLFSGDNSNFGMAPEPLVKEAQLDSVVLVNDSTAIMVTSEFCGRYSRYSQWKAGKDTVYNHPVFCKKLSVDSMRTLLKTQYFFRNKIDSVKFIGYDNYIRQQPEEQKRNTLPVIVNYQKPGNNNKILWVLISLSLVVAVFGGIVYHKYRQIYHSHTLNNY